MGLTWALLVPGGPRVGPIEFTIGEAANERCFELGLFHVRTEQWNILHTIRQWHPHVIYMALSIIINTSYVLHGILMRVFMLIIISTMSYSICSICYICVPVHPILYLSQGRSWQLAILEQQMRLYTEYEKLKSNHTQPDKTALEKLPI